MGCWVGRGRCLVGVSGGKVGEEGQGERAHGAAIAGRNVFVGFKDEHCDAGEVVGGPPE